MNRDHITNTAAVGVGVIGAIAMFITVLIGLAFVCAFLYIVGYLLVAAL